MSIDPKTDRISALSPDTLGNLVVENPGDYVIIVSDPRGKIVSWNPAADKVLGWPASAAVGQTVHIFFTPEDRDAGVPETERRRATENGVAVDERWHIKRDGSRFWASGQLTTLRHDGELVGHSKILRDRTGERLTEERLRIAQQAGAIGSFELFPDTRRIAPSEQFCRLWGVPPKKEFDVADFLALVHPDDRQRLITGNNRLPDHALNYIEYRIVRPDTGEVRWMARRGELVRDEPGGTGRYIGVCYDITERKRIENDLRETNARLRESETHFRQLAELAPAITWFGNPDGTVSYLVSYLNSRWYEYTGQSAEDALPWGWAGAVHPDDIEPLLAVWQDARNRGAPYETEARLRRHDGFYHWHLIRSQPLRDEQGQVAGWLGSNIDVHERKMAEAALRGSEQRQAFLLALGDRLRGLGNPEKILLTASEALGRHLDISRVSFGQVNAENEQATFETGWAKGAAIPLAGAFPLGALAPGNASSLSQGKTSVLETHLLDTSVIDPMTLERLNRLDIHASIAVPLMKDGMLTGVLCATDGHSRAWSPDDIALAEEVAERTWEEIDRVRGGRELERRAETATAERDRIWRMSRDIMAVASLNGYFLSVNPAFTAALGWSQQEATAIPLMELTHPEHREDLAQKLGVLAQGLPLVRYEIRDLHKDGSHRWLSWTIVPEGDLLYGVARDITDEKRQSGALRHAEDALRQSQKMEAVGQLTGGIAHDFNNLLASMVGNLEMTKARIGQGYTGDLARYIDRALIVADRAAALTHRLLAFSRRQTLDSRPTDVNRLVASMGNLIQRTVGPAIQVDTRLPDGLWNTLCDPNQLESALLNLAINARDAMPGGGRLKIETSNIIIDEVYAAEYPGIVPGEYVAISVTDTGTGMPPDVLACAFDPFFTTKPLGQGTGLGLSMIYGFAKQSGGQIRIYSEQGKGTTVRLKLPRHLGEAEAGPAISTLAGMPQATKNRTILLVDDEADLRNLLAEMLEMLGYSTIEAADGAEGMRILESSQRVDLLVTDVGLPGDMNGRKLAEAARMSRPGLQVLFITGYAENVAAGSELLASGMQLMTKPFGIDAFAARVRSMIDATQARHERGQERG